jgi:methylated-DNA-[protein]-cysteine S-methyltransferase
MLMTQSIFTSPVGHILIKCDAVFITALLFTDESGSQKIENELYVNTIEEIEVIEKCRQQLTEYFEGKRTSFDLPLQQDGTDFQQKIWAELLRIPFGQTISYMELAKRTGDTKAIRAVGTTNGKNQLSIVVHCHRVIGSNGTLTGYSGGLWRKQWLLEHEAVIAHGVQTLF